MIEKNGTKNDTKKRGKIRKSKIIKKGNQTLQPSGKIGTSHVPDSQQVTGTINYSL